MVRPNASILDPAAASGKGTEPARWFVDRRGREWRVDWWEPAPTHEATAVLRKRGLVFAGDSTLLHLPLDHWVDARLLTSSQLNSLLGRALPATLSPRSSPESRGTPDRPDTARTPD